MRAVQASQLIARDCAQFCAHPRTSWSAPEFGADAGFDLSAFLDPRSRCRERPPIRIALDTSGSRLAALWRVELCRRASEVVGAFLRAGPPQVVQASSNCEGSLAIKTPPPILTTDLCEIQSVFGNPALAPMQLAPEHLPKEGEHELLVRCRSSHGYVRCRNRGGLRSAGDQVQLLSKTLLLGVDLWKQIVLPCVLYVRFLARGFPGEYLRKWRTNNDAEAGILDARVAELDGCTATPCPPCNRGKRTIGRARQGRASWREFRLYRYRSRKRTHQSTYQIHDRLDTSSLWKLAWTVRCSQSEYRE